MNIVICDDDNGLLLSTKAWVEKFFSKEKLSISTFSNTAEFIDFFKNDGFADIIIMDIELDNGNNGIDIIKSLKDKITGSRVIYLTGFIEYASPVYETEHEYFVLKSQIEQHFEKALGKAHCSLLEKPDKLYIESRFAKAFIDCNNILYIERNRRTTSVVCKDETHYTSEPLDSILGRLNEDIFIRCHNSYIVNAKMVKVYANNVFTLISGSTIKVTRSHKKQAENKFIAFIKSSFSH